MNAVLDCISWIAALRAGPPWRVGWLAIMALGWLAAPLPAQVTGGSTNPTPGGSMSDQERINAMREQIQERMRTLSQQQQPANRVTPGAQRTTPPGGPAGASLPARPTSVRPPSGVNSTATARDLQEAIRKQREAGASQEDINAFIRKQQQSGVPLDILTQQVSGGMASLRRTRGAAQSGGGKYPGRGRPALLLSDKARVPHATFYLWPASFSVHVGESIVTECRFANPDTLPLDEIRVLLTYPRGFVEPVSVHQDAIHSLLAGEPEFRDRPERGEMEWRCRLGEPLKSEEVRVLTIVWKALAPTEGLWIRSSIEGVATNASIEGRSITRGNRGVADGATDAYVRILRPDEAVPPGHRFVENTLASMQARLAGFPDQRSLRPPTLWIDQPEDETLEAGREVVISLGIDNPDRMLFDEVRLAARFDPRTVEVLDADRGNWIGSGLNLLDAPFHKDWPWDLQYSNRVDADRGIFDYHMGMTTPREQPSGTVAQLHLRVRQETRGPLVEWVWNPKESFDTPTTGIYLYGENVHLRGTKDAGKPGSIIAGGEGTLAETQGLEKADPSLYRF